MITEAKWRRLHRQMRQLNIQDNEIEEKFVVGSGRGGQKLHKSATCVCLKHRPSGIHIKCQQTRSREDNRYFARQRLCEKIAQQQHQIQSEKQKKIDKIRRQKKRRSRRAKQRILDDKQHVSRLKDKRKKIKPDSPT